MSETVTVSVEIPVDELRAWRGAFEEHRKTYECWLHDPNMAARARARAFLAVIEADLPPEPIMVGDRVQTSLDGLGDVLALYDEWAWVKTMRQDSPISYHLGHLTKVDFDG